MKVVSLLRPQVDTPQVVRLVYSFITGKNQYWHNSLGLSIHPSIRPSVRLYAYPPVRTPGRPPVRTFKIRIKYELALLKVWDAEALLLWSWMTQDQERQQHILGGRSTGQWPGERRTISILCVCSFVQGFQTAEAYSIWGRTKVCYVISRALARGLSLYISSDESEWSICIGFYPVYMRFAAKVTADVHAQVPGTAEHASRTCPCSMLYVSRGVLAVAILMTWHLEGLN